MNLETAKEKVSVFLYQQGINRQDVAIALEFTRRDLIIVAGVIVSEEPDPPLELIEEFVYIPLNMN